MSPVTKQIVELVSMLPEQEQQLAYELIKRIVLAWDPDFSKLTSVEKESLEKADKEIEDGNLLEHSEIDWS